MSYLTILLNSAHRKNEFDCGKEMLNSYLQRQANQDMQRHLSVCFVIVDNDDLVKGYYTLSNASIDRDSIPEDVKNKLPKSYTNLPVTLLGRLARDKRQDGERLGEILLLDALKRCYDASATVGSLAVVVDPIDEESKNFYLKYGFILLPDSHKLFLPMKTIGYLFEK
ncbi:MAG TPA: GNAT family N-acetyltransferase [Prolixibacteraceae bacterium]|jgi:predicted GNAT family N-acyltransferase